MILGKKVLFDFLIFFFFFIFLPVFFFHFRFFSFYFLFFFLLAKMHVISHSQFACVNHGDKKRRGDQTGKPTYTESYNEASPF